MLAHYTVTQSDITWWERKRAKGFFRFLVSQGIAHYGLRVGLTITLLAAVVHFFSAVDLLMSLKILFIVFLFMTVVPGFLIGITLWRQFEKDYQKYHGKIPLR
jgi:hypothetical protein